MKKLVALALMLGMFLVPSAFAGVPCTLPFNLTNGTTADATQVMANYNALVTCLTQAAHAGANADITSITGLTTPLSQSQGGSVSFAGSDSTGTANAQVVASTVPSAFTLVKGNIVVFKTGVGPNTGNVTLTVGGTAATQLLRQAGGGVTGLAGGELQNGFMNIVIYDGTFYQLISPNSLLGFKYMFRDVIDQVVTGGWTTQTLVNPTGNLTIDCGARALQNITNNGPWVLTAPATDGTCDLLIINGPSAGTITTSGFNVGTNTGDTIDLINGHQFMLHIRRVFGASVVFVQALQ